MIRKEAWSFYRTISGVRLCWELEEPEGPKGPHREPSALNCWILEILYCDLKGRRALLRVPSTVGRSVCLLYVGLHQNLEDLKDLLQDLKDLISCKRGITVRRQVLTPRMHPHRCSYMSASLITNRHPVGPYSGFLPMALWCLYGGGAVSYERGTPVEVSICRTYRPFFLIFTWKSAFKAEPTCRMSSSVRLCSKNLKDLKDL